MPEDDVPDKKPQRPKNGGKAAEKPAAQNAGASPAVTPAPPAEPSAIEKPEKTAPPSKPAAGSRPSSGAASAAAMERPVMLGPTPVTTEYVVTVNNTTGLAVKIERVEEGGKRIELSPAEYARIGTQPAAAMSRSTAPSSDAELLEAYYRGVADYVRAITGT